MHATTEETMASTAQVLLSSSVTIAITDNVTGRSDFQIILFQILLSFPDSHCEFCKQTMI